MDERGNIWDQVCGLDKINCEIGIQKRGSPEARIGIERRNMKSQNAERMYGY